jgi:DNA repair protein RecO (recombination protein O)
VRYEKVRAVVLGSRPVGEADRVLRLFTRELGRVDAVVRGVRKTSSRWGGRLEPFTISDLMLYQGRSLYTVTQAQLVDVFRRLREHREALAAAAVVCEAAAGLFVEHEPEERVYALLRNTLRELDEGIEGPAVRAPLLLGALLKLLYEAGYLPVLDRCVACGGGGRALGFSAARGGLVCEACLDECLPITPEAVEALCVGVGQPLTVLRALPPSAAAEEALRDAHELYAYHSGFRLRSLRFARNATSVERAF